MGVFGGCGGEEWGAQETERERKKMKRMSLFGGLGLEESGVEGFSPLLWLLHL